jgi:hypothetical protein
MWPSCPSIRLWPQAKPFNRQSPCGRYGGNCRITSIAPFILDLGNERDEWYASQCGRFISATQWMEGWVGPAAVCSRTRNTQLHTSQPKTHYSSQFQILAIQTKGYSEHSRTTVDAVNCIAGTYRTLAYSTAESKVTTETPWNRVLLEKITGPQPVKTFPVLYGNQEFITTFTTARHLSLSWATSIQWTSPITLIEDPFE